MEENDYAVLDSNSEDSNSPKRFRITNAVEIPLLLMMFSFALSVTQISNVILYRSCVHALNHTTTECRPFLSPDRMNYTPEQQKQMNELEQETQEYANMINTVDSVLGAAVPAVLSLFVGVWSDKHGRKPLIMWSLMGMTLNSIVIVVYTMSPSLGPWWFVALSAGFSLFGGFSVMMTGAMCYITDVTDNDTRTFSGVRTRWLPSLGPWWFVGFSFFGGFSVMMTGVCAMLLTDVTDNDTRTFKLVMVQMIFAVGMASGSMLSPYVLRAVGTVLLFFIVAFLHTCAYAFSAVVLEESLTGVAKGSILTVLDLTHIKDMFRECFKSRPNQGRPKLLLPIAATTLSTFTLYGASSLVYLYTRNKLQWTMKDYTTFSAISTVWVLGGFFGVALLQKILHISDLSFAAIAMFSCIAENVIKALANTTWQMYLGSIVSFFGSVSGPMTRSFLTKSLPSQDIGKVFGLLGSAESFCPLLAPLVYNALYAFTLTSYPGAFLLLTAGIYAVSLVFILIVKYLVIRSPDVAYHLIDDAFIID